MRTRKRDGGEGRLALNRDIFKGENSHLLGITKDIFQTGHLSDDTMLRNRQELPLIFIVPSPEEYTFIFAEDISTTEDHIWTYPIQSVIP